jgi:hypothetical protein
VTHGDDCVCYRCKLRSVQWGPVIDVAPQTAMERRWEADMPAYARLRADGLQPRHIDGSARLEATMADGQMDIDLGHLLSRDQYGQARECMEEARSVDGQVDWSETVAAYKHKQAQL